jgi:predicted subunit of tRNA(5-methylaminomethyl-2-thiouridylate) methyltransferase
MTNLEANVLPEVLYALCVKAGCKARSPASWLQSRLKEVGYEINLRTIHWWFHDEWPRPSDAARTKLVEALNLDESDELHLYRVISAGPVSYAS